ncbi:hypothetical protein BAMA_10415 [Bacillus manliponensis]|uniref:ABC transporter permease n=1 Tax=Bacillus manliponensis TaxID=574376 RepID=A0A073JUJ1_9BACI|nr:ABC transporter permease [Bacillus manliponensis]KEK17892.1 hypothetical protein BAMA_10415 [Bacillus manliponensis]
MSNLINLILNEKMKIYAKRSNQFMIAFIVLSVIIGAIFIKFNSPEITETSEDNWKTELAALNKDMEIELQKNPDSSMKESFEEHLTINKYRIENDINPKPNNVWTFVNKLMGIISLISLFTIIVAGGIVSNEFNWGTIKLLLMRPISRTEILIAKYLTTLLFSLTLLLILFSFSWILGIALFGSEGTNVPYLTYENGTVKETSMLNHVLIQYGLRSINLIMMATFAFMISSIFNNSSFAIGSSIFLMMTGNTIVAFLKEYSWVKYILFANTDLNQYFSGNPLVKGMTLEFSIVVLLTYFILFMSLSFICFNKKNIVT